MTWAAGQRSARASDDDGGVRERALAVCPAGDDASAPVRDTFWHGRLEVWQPARGHGYRFNLDPVLLAHFCPAAGTVVELGAGCGILSLLLLASGKARAATAIEVQPALAALAQRNAVANGLQRCLQVEAADLRTVTGPQADLVVFNPPYFRAGEGRASPQPGREAGRREQHGTLADFVACARRLVTPQGQVAAVLPVGRVDELRALGAASGLHLRVSREVIARHGIPPHLALSLFAMEAPTPALMLAPLCMHADTGRTFTAELLPWVDGTAASPTDLLP